ncbi:MAG: MFS transporter [Alphaproteobacteria bacterium]|uniref:MFS transporter n=1 Tax=Brevundimonas sp. BAL3 TaxID=391600 RepID=UPI00017EDBBD|nr:MFS transporter [Brevundimonas sp. BAL3]EDX80678.1 Tat pathway signal sequence domain protein [Brevundimonas sp. BAL3]PZO09104.1 MAG: MFS transporter [Alphaproteobacteria bacterium]
MTGARRQLGQVIGEVPDWKPHERPMMPGSPSTPDFSNPVRLGYGLVALLLGLTGGLGTALVAVNLPAIQGELGLDPVQGAWLSTVYVMFNVSMNLLVIKYRQQFGLTSFVMVFLSIYALAAFAHLATDSFTGALAVRALSGVGGAALGVLAVFYMLQAFPAKLRLPALILGIGVSQLGMPLARIISPDLLDLGNWHGLYVLEAGLALSCLAAVRILRLPPGVRIHAFERRDFFSFVLLAGGLGLIVAVAGLGRVEWWFEAPWLGWALALAVILIAGGAAFEHHRANPLVDTRWLFTGSFFRFAVSILLVRVLLSEQTFGSTGLLQTVGMGAEQLRHLYGVVLMATVAGVLVSAFSLLISPKLVIIQVLLSLILIAVGAFMDAGATAQTHAANLYVSQALLGFAGAMFMGAAVIIGVGQLLARGFGSVVTFAVMFGATQVLGGVLGAAALSTFQVMRAQHHGAYLSEAIVGADPQAAALLQTYGGAFASTVADRSVASLNGVSTLAQQVTQQANILAFNDVFFVIGVTAVVQLIVSLALIVRQAIKAKANPQPAGDAAGAVAI